ncbi:MAG: O-antigen ligase family protein [Pyrinomonadaceae bacterium]
MNSLINNIAPRESLSTRRSPLLWVLPVTAVSVFTVWAITSGGQALRTWLLGALLWLMALPLLVSLEAGLLAMMIFEPFRGLLRRAQYLFVDYTATDPIHVLTPLVTLLAVAVLLKTHGLGIVRKTPLAGSISLLGLIYLVQIFNPLQGGLFIGLAGALFMLVPLIWFYFGQEVKLHFLTIALRLIVFVGLIASLYGIYQLVFGYPAFEQYWLDNTEFYNSIAVAHVQRALATFSSAEEWGRYIEIGAIIAFGFGAAATRLLRRVGWLLAGAGLTVGLLLTGQRTAIFGFILGAAVLLLLGTQTLRGLAMRAVILLLPVLLVAFLAKAPSEDEMWSKGENEKVGTLVSHATRGTLNPAGEESMQARLETWTYLATNVLPARPLGAGLGAGTLSETKFNQSSDMPPIDSFIIVLAIACGIPAALLFLWILARAMWMSMRAARRAAVGTPEAAIARIVAALIPAIILNTFFGLTFTLYSVAPIAWLVIGWISAEELRARTVAAESANVKQTLVSGRFTRSQAEACATPAGAEI